MIVNTNSMTTIFRSPWNTLDFELTLTWETGPWWWDFLLLRVAETTQMHGTDSKNLFSWAISITENIASQRHFPNKTSRRPKLFQNRGWMYYGNLNISSYNWDFRQWSLEIGSTEFCGEVAIVDVHFISIWSRKHTHVLENNVLAICACSGKDQNQTVEQNWKMDGKMTKLSPFRASPFFWSANWVIQTHFPQLNLQVTKYQSICKTKAATTWSCFGAKQWSRQWKLIHQHEE